MAKASEEIDLDVVLAELGSFGRYQVRAYLLILVPIVCSGAFGGNFIFNAADTPHRCMVPECEKAPLEYEPDSWGEWALKEGAKCERPTPVGNTCSPEGFDHTQTTHCTAFVYEHNNTIVAEFNLGCQDWKRTMVGTIRSLGTFSALCVIGFISDTYGRKITFILTSLLRAVAGVVRAFSPNYTMYMILEFLEAGICSGVYSTGFILALEMISLKRRVLGGSMISSSFAVGQMILAVASWYFPYWRTLTLVLYLPSVVFIFYFCLLGESVRWLLSKGYKNEAVKIIFKAADVNDAQLSAHTIGLLLAPPQIVHTTSKPGTTEPQKSLAKQVMGSRVMVSRLAICSFWWVTSTFIYYGLSINSVSLGGNKHVNFILSSLVEIPGYCASIVTLDRFGRKSSIMISLYICGISLIALPFVSGSVSKVLTLVGKMCISMVFTSIYIYTSELFPTQARHSLMGFCSAAGRIGTMCAPQTPLLMAYMESLPYLIFGTMAGAAGLLMLLTPETLNQRLPDTVAEAEHMASAKNEQTDTIDDNITPTK